MTMPKPLKEDELRDLAVCAACHQKIMHTGVPLFWRVTLDRFGVRADKVKRQDGLAVFMGSSMLAGLMGPNEDMAEPVMDTKTVSVCEECATSIHAMPIAILAESKS